MRFEFTRPAGSYVLAHHSLKEWAQVTYDRLIALGCTDTYAVSQYRRIKRGKEST